ncbi:hypothetical protein [Chryseobacterium jejuense]|uniref:hypothetical protein n=1 Tax=Chryseobacterium jejuense TaxID=445960 RepID=UPI001AE54D5D|nr:hypothetical protein [Chryseobacterium jejuense]MBP2618385.1 hypothetical protein [Chryseobacterium jejuense]
MKRKNIFLIVVVMLAGLFILFRPDIFIKEIFASKMTMEIPKRYSNSIPKTFISSHVYTLDYSDSPSVSFYRNEKADFITAQYKGSFNTKIIYSNNAFESLTNKFSSAFEFQNSLVRYFNKNITNEKVRVVNLNGNYTIKNTVDKNMTCIFFTGDFEVFMNNKRVIYYKSSDKSSVIIKKYESFIQLYIINDDNDEIINKFLL